MIKTIFNSNFAYLQHPSENSFRFNIIGGSSSSKGYQAFGFSKTGKMEDSDVYYCTSFKVGVSTIGDLHDTPVDTTSVCHMLFVQIKHFIVIYFVT